MAAILIGRTAGAKGFNIDASFGLQTGTAPVPCSTGNRRQYRLNRGGDRPLSRARHIIAITHARVDPQPRPASNANRPKENHHRRDPQPEATPRASIPRSALDPALPQIDIRK
jgi:transposase